MKIWVILPAYNEEHSIPKLFPEIRESMNEFEGNYEIVVVDDGSLDNTSKILLELKNQFPVTVLKHKINRGLGESERDAFEYVAENGHDEDIAVRLDCDDTHEPDFILSLIKKLNEGFDVVNTSRFQPGGGQMGVSLYRSIISYCANIFMKLVFNIDGVKDYSCGFRAYRVGILKAAVDIFGNTFLQLKGLGFTSTLETIVKLKLLGCKFAEVPFVLRYDKKVGSSKMITSITTLGYIVMAILYHWPFGGWAWSYRKLAGLFQKSPCLAVEKFRQSNIRKNFFCKIGS
jgi:dolichol-phosphate mannosyltransferase